jgi:5-bromo-4-chloroindolyl phosphate hydrolysis protein
MAILPIPELPVAKTYNHPFLMRILFSFGWASASAAITVIIGWSTYLTINSVAWLFIGIMAALAFVMIFILTFVVDLSQPRITYEEVWFRKRLDEARQRNARVAQLNADYEVLSAAADSLYQKLGKEKFSTLKDAAIIDHAIELVRKKTVD